MLWIWVLLTASVGFCQTVNRTNWTVSVDSYESQSPQKLPNYAIDNTTSTFWQSQYKPTGAPLPHNITINFNATLNLTTLYYVPRQDGILDGNIGQHQWQVSLDNKTWTTVAIGTYRDDDETKTTHIAPVQANYLRLLAFTEAGNRGPWTTVADLTVGTAPNFTAAATSGGIWSQALDFPIVPVAAAIIPQTGSVLTWSSSQPGDYHAEQSTYGPGNTLTSTYDPITNTVTEINVQNTDHNMFCPGLSMDVQGRPFVTGGDTATRTSLYNSALGNWTALAEMYLSRGYQASTYLSDGRVFTIGGSWANYNASYHPIGGKNGEVYNFTTNTWTYIPGAAVAPMLTADNAGIYRQDNHGWLFGWKNGSIFQAGPSIAMNWYGATNGGWHKTAGSRTGDADSMCGTATMYDAVAGLILTLGGAPDYENSYSTNNSHIITIPAINKTATVQTINSMTYPRVFHNSIILADGKVLVIGGQTFSIPFSDLNAVLVPELWNPVDNSFTPMNPVAAPKVYHSVGLLMPDGTVFSAGSGLEETCNCNHYDGQIFQPPYLFNSDGTIATRPVISSISSTTVVLGASFSVTMDSTVTAFSLIRYGSATHTVNTDQRRIPLTPVVSGNKYTMTIPSDPGVALPGYWMLFAINAAGTPSISTTVLIPLPSV